MPYFFIDYWYLVLVLPAVLFSLFAQIKVKSTFSKYSRHACRITGRAASEAIQRAGGIRVSVTATPGQLTDHYDPRSNVIRLSEPVCDAATVAAVGVAAHETGHALQYAEGYGPIRLRTAIVPITNFASQLSPYLVIFGIILSFDILAYIGVALFFMAVLFQLITLPVEFNASSRALKALRQQAILSEEELRGARKVLTAAAMTYVAALFVSLMSFLRLLLIVRGRGRRDR